VELLEKPGNTPVERQLNGHTDALCPESIKFCIKKSKNHNNNKKETESRFVLRIFDKPWVALGFSSGVTFNFFAKCA